MRLSVVVPCFNEIAVLPALRARLMAACQDAVGEDFEIVLVDDGSTDGTRRLIAAYHSEDPRVVGVLLSRNHGHQLALAAGLSFCRGERVLILDADLQDPPELLPQMMARMDQGFDVVFGRRRSRAGETRFKTGAAHLFYRVLRRFSTVEIAADAGDFRLLSRRVVDIVVKMPEEHRFLRGMISWIGFAQSPFDYDRAPRLAGETKYPLRKMLRLAADALTGFSTLPLRLASYAGFAFAGMGVLLMIYVLASWLAGAVVAGWTSLMATVLIIGSVQLIVVGILGEYIGRLYMQSKARPLFIVDQLLRDEAERGLR
ncbi:MAG: glycosyltransferase [Rhodobacterales bacterium RIFCSPHIGHO2_02_FULL_62_130]|nr:MAG: glycosyltransferase [Rhodobacterales bacterium RIFCSPHIGHO2_02_FULL_62_130]OHC55060.1 MAG: glycosyltransferase [Rhodobacterales bacterium RIFCSPHIGHO2_12_FULL_62_75]HCY99487.1 glycosyltransferase [Rhodobacter sp.]